MTGEVELYMIWWCKWSIWGVIRERKILDQCMDMYVEKNGLVLAYLFKELRLEKCYANILHPRPCIT